MNRKVNAKDYSKELAERFAARYDSGARTIKTELVRELLGNISNKKVLDVGAGIGFFSNMCCDLGAVVVAVDFSSEMIKKIKKRYGNKFLAQKCKAHQLPFHNDRFDIVLLLDVIEHLYKVQLTLTEIRRVLKPEGKLIITTPSTGYSIDNFLRIILGKFSWRKKPFSFEVHTFSQEELVSLMKARGFHLTYFETFPNRASYGIVGRVMELLRKKILTNLRWSSSISSYS
jgi:malonyl-CoA O-methyltransferase